MVIQNNLGRKKTHPITWLQYGINQLILAVIIFNPNKDRVVADRFQRGHFRQGLFDIRLSGQVCHHHKRD